MKKTNFFAIFATMFVAATVIMLASCSQDDEYYEDGLFTRADEMMTRAGEPGGYTPTPPIQTPVPKDTIETTYVFSFVPNTLGYNNRLPTFDVRIDVRLFKYQYEDGEGNIKEELVAELIGYGIPYNLKYPAGSLFIDVLETSFLLDEIYLELDSLLDNRFKLCASGSIAGSSRRDYSYKGEVPNTIFY